jgi:hypothetical protein
MHVDRVVGDLGLQRAVLDCPAYPGEQLVGASLLDPAGEVADGVDRDKCPVTLLSTEARGPF